MKRIKFFAVFKLAVMILFASCVFKNVYKGTGNVTKQERIVNSFNTLDLSVVYDVVIIPSQYEKVIVETDDNLQKLVLIENHGNSLMIKMKENINIKKKKKGKIYVYTKELSKIKNSSVGNVTSLGKIKTHQFFLNNSSVGNTALKIKAEVIDINNRSVGNTELAGACEKLEIKNSSVGNLNAKSLECQVLDLNNKSVGDAKFTAQKEMYIRNSGIGNLHVYGDGIIIKKRNWGIGNFVKH